MMLFINIPIEDDKYIQIDKNNTRKFRRYYHKGKHTDYLVSEYGDVYSEKRNLMMKSGVNKKGYVRIDLMIDGSKVGVSIHRMVALAFIGICKECPDNEDMEVNHKDGDKTNNFVENLEWSTHAENIEHARETNLYQKGEVHFFNKYSDDTIYHICDLFVKGVSFNEITQLTGVPQTYLVNLINKRKRKCITTKFDFSNHEYFIKVNREQLFRQPVFEILRKDMTLKPKDVCHILNIEPSEVNRKAILWIKHIIKTENEGSTTRES